MPIKSKGYAGQCGIGHGGNARMSPSHGQGMGPANTKGGGEGKKPMSPKFPGQKGIGSKGVSKFK